MRHVLNALVDLFPLAASGDVGAPLIHERTLMALSMAVAVVGAGAALELGSRSLAHSGRAALLWRAGSGLSMGVAVWAMHFIGLVALDTPLMRGFLLGPTLWSLAIAALLGSGGYVIGGDRFRLWRYAVAGAVFGCGGVAMHYVGMRGLVIDAELSYRPIYLAGTSAAAVATSIVSLWLCTSARPRWARLVLAFPVGAVMSGIHFFDMAGAVLSPSPHFSSSVQDTRQLGVWVALAAAGLAAAAFGLSYIDERGVLTRRPRAKPASGDPAEGVVIIPEAPQRGPR